MSSLSFRSSHHCTRQISKEISWLGVGPLYHSDHNIVLVLTFLRPPQGVSQLLGNEREHMALIGVH